MLLPVTQMERAADDGKNAVVAVALHQLAVLYSDQKKHDRAEPLFRRSLLLSTPVEGPANLESATCHADFAMSLRTQKRFAEAEVHIRRALDIQRQIGATDHPSFVRGLEMHGELLRKQKRTKEAREVARAAALLRSGGSGRPMATVDASELIRSR
jgi:tetratricopeptide (TPR) repeat protein